MKTALHILTRPDDPFVRGLLAQPPSPEEGTVVVIDLTVPAPDYAALLEGIFAADSVAVW